VILDRSDAHFDPAIAVYELNTLETTLDQIESGTIAPEPTFVIENPSRFLNITCCHADYRHIETGPYLGFLFELYSAASHTVTSKQKVTGRASLAGQGFRESPEVVTSDSDHTIQRGDRGILVIRQYLIDKEIARVLSARESLDEFPSPNDPFFNFQDVRSLFNISTQDFEKTLPNVPVTPTPRHRFRISPDVKGGYVDSKTGKTYNPGQVVALPPEELRAFRDKLEPIK